MGKGDQRTRRGKLNRGTYGKPRPRNKKRGAKAAARAKARAKAKPTTK